MALTVAAGCTGGSKTRPTGTVVGFYARAMGLIKAPHSDHDKVTLIDAQGRRQVTAVSPSGHFTITAKPGTYTLTGPPGSPRYDCQRIRVTIAARKVTRARIQCGIATD
jgi:hypothetical protein